jgi:hypothetical protein
MNAYFKKINISIDYKVYNFKINKTVSFFFLKFTKIIEKIILTIDYLTLYAILIIVYA